MTAPAMAASSSAEPAARSAVHTPAAGEDQGDRRPAPGGASSAAAIAASSTAGHAADPPAASAAPSDEEPADDGDFLGLAQPKRGFRIATRGRVIQPDSDVEYCEVAEVPGTPGELYVVSGAELANAEGSHHLIVAMAAPDSAADRQVRALDVGTQVVCVGATQEFGQAGMSVLASTQTRYAKSELPKGVAQRVYGGQRLVFDYHYFNFGNEPLVAKSALAVHTQSTDEPVTFINSLAFTNMTIDTPPKSDGTFTATCQLAHDVMLLGVARHTHQHGTDFTVWHEGGAHSGELVWTSKDWEHDTEFRFPEPQLFRAGEGLKFACSFHNEGLQPLRFGISSRDEMCILAGAIWSPTPQAEIGPEECVISWVDAQGIGHDADDAGGFPAPDAADVLACHAGSLGLSVLDGCLGCICDACATVLARCNADPDCKALLDCSSSCSKLGSPECQQRCEPQMFEHSCGVGMVAQAGECIRSRCGERCALGAVAETEAP